MNNAVRILYLKNIIENSTIIWSGYSFETISTAFV